MLNYCIYNIRMYKIGWQFLLAVSLVDAVYVGAAAGAVGVPLGHVPVDELVVRGELLVHLVVEADVVCWMSQRTVPNKVDIGSQLLLSN